MVVRLLPSTEATPRGKYVCLRVIRPPERTTRLSITGISIATVSEPLRNTLMNDATTSMTAISSLSLEPTKR